MPQALLLALRQMGDPAFRLPLILGVLGAALAVAGLIGLAAWLAGWAAAGGPEWLSWITQAGGAAAGVFLGWWLFLPVALGIAAQFTDSVAGAVERRHYPGLAAPSGASALAQAGYGVWFGVKLLALQLLLLPLFFIPFLGALLALLISAHGLGAGLLREVALRRMNLAHSRIAWQRLRWQGWMLGLALALMAMVPVLNLFVPIIGIAAAAHLLIRGLGGFDTLSGASTKSGG
ncbi:MAG: EI24 domain-containing protein [Roseomonas sp.]|nr:EI24 domain-containing protein [Roseomonas sp.]MCA3428869.1 EI24 domain-containing protein [Roseomonas sp.]MCA3434792.1 EI24 domain-containing protein [Roseomonas sp.]